MSKDACINVYNDITVFYSIIFYSLEKTKILTMENRKLKTVLLGVACLCGISLSAKDVLIFGNRGSELRHGLKDSLTEAYMGGMNETARRMLNAEQPDWKGGKMKFRMKVNPDRQNYFTVRCWGSESDETVVMLFIEGKQVGYRHLGDYDLLHRGNGGKPCPGRFYYYTLPLPLKYTQGKKEVELEMRSYGKMWDYGYSFEQYQKNMEAPTIGFYKAYTDIEPCYEPEKKEKQGTAVVANAPVRTSPGREVLDELKRIMNRRIDAILLKNAPLGQQEVWLLADAYSVKWTNAYHNPEVTAKVCGSIDAHYRKYLDKPAIIYTDGSVYNGDWMTTCMLARSIRALWGDIKGLDELIDGNVTRREAWARLMEASLEYGTTHRRHYTNQSMIIDMAVYECNRALMLLDARRALPEYQTLRYLYESLALAPWLGKETANGPERPLGDNYWQLTDKGLTKELGFVGYYGEVIDWLIHIYEATSIPGVPYSGDEKLKDQLLRVAGARYNFRYPAVDDEGYRCFRAEAVVGWRDGNHYPGDVMYGDRGTAWDATPIMTAAATLDPWAVGIAQQMLADNQFFAMVSAKLKDSGNIRSLQSCLHIPDQYETIMSQPVSGRMLPMSGSMPDYVFSDEEDGVVAVKNGDEILYASLYWRARNAVNNLAKVHYITPVMERLANVTVKTKFEDSGMRYERPDWVNLGFLGSREWYEGIHSAHAGEVLPVARIPEGVPFKVGDENIYAGKADYYQLEYGKYIIVMNTTKEKTFEYVVPEGGRTYSLTEGGREVKERVITLAPRTTYVLYRD